MIILDKALEDRARENNPVQVALIGAGYMGRGIALQIARYIPGMRLAAVYNRTRATAERAYEEAGIESFQFASSTGAVENAVARDQYVVTDDPLILCEAEGIDALIFATGQVVFGAEVAAHAIDHGKHVVLMNAELDATVGPILKKRADSAGVVYTGTDGDQPGVAMNLFRFVKTIGYSPVLIGNIKGLLDRYRTPETQRAFAEAANQDVKMVTNFADGTKLCIEQAVMANATGFPVGRRGMYGPECDHVDQCTDLFPAEELLRHGLTDYILGAQPGPGVFVIGHNDHPARRQYMDILKMGKGPFYSFYVPYHLCHLESPLSAARAAIFGDAAIAPLGAPVCEVITTAKRDLKAGEVLDGIGGFMAYGLIDNVDVCRRDNLLPIGLSEGCRLKRSIRKDEAISFDNVQMPERRRVDELWDEQLEVFGQESFTPMEAGAPLPI